VSIYKQVSTFPQSEDPPFSGQCRRKVDRRLKLPGPDYIAYFFLSFSVVTLLSTVPINPRDHSATSQSPI